MRRGAGKMGSAALAALALAALPGCPTEPPDHVEIFRVTNPPPAAEASIVSRDGLGHEIYEIELSLGVAIAARCWDTCGPDWACTGAKLTAEDPSILGVRPVFRSGAPNDEFALVATGEGTTTLRVQASCTSQTYQVTVLRP
jgi:hypothetical protein